VVEEVEEKRSKLRWERMCGQVEVSELAEEKFLM
jgi:hypothetical protein